MRRVIALAASSAMASVAFAAPLDFSSVTTPVDLTLQACVIGDVTITYDDMGDESLWAVVDSTGISGSSAGGLFLTFDSAAESLLVNWTVENVSGQPSSEPGLFFTTDASGYAELPGTYEAYSPIVPDVGHLTGSLDYQGAPFTTATFYFATGFEVPVTGQEASFTIQSVGYQVPEPAVFGIAISVSGGLLVRRRARKSS